MLQLREKELPPRQLFELALELRQLTNRYQAQLIINDRLDIALAVGADGVQLGMAGLPLTEARRLLGNNMLIGYSAHGVAEGVQAVHDGADFVTFGPVFDTPSKRCYGAPLGLQLLRQAATEIPAPVYALGGISAATVADVMATGCHGVALISAVIAAQHPGEAARELLRTISQCSL